MNQRQTGKVIAAFGRQFSVQLADKQIFNCVTRGKKTELVCGDLVEISQTSELQGVIEQTLDRQSLLYRSDNMRSKLIAANVTQVIIVMATEPSFSDELLARCILAAETQELQVLLVLNKCDLGEAAIKQAMQPLQVYQELGYSVLQLSARQDASQLAPHLEHHTSVLVGQSGMGKSTLINQLIPQAQAATREISSALDSGKHTTTHAKLYALNEHSFLIDCPGVQAFGLHHLTHHDIEIGFKEFREHLGHCRFNNCKHWHEPNCAIQKALAEGHINLRRYELYCQISQSIAR